MSTQQLTITPLVATIFIFFFEIQDFCLKKCPAKQQCAHAAVWNSFLLIGLLLDGVYEERKRRLSSFKAPKRARCEKAQNG